MYKKVETSLHSLRPKNDRLVLQYLEYFNAHDALSLPAFAGEVGDVQHIAGGCRESAPTSTDGK